MSYCKAYANIRGEDYYVAIIAMIEWCRNAS